MLNTQKPESPAQDKTGSALVVVGIFRTIQGEGPFSGVPAIFIRLGGCNLACPGCDTNYTDGRALMDVAQILSLVASAKGHHAVKLAVITGGEPFRQYINHLAHALQQDGLHVQVETNGTLPVPPGFPSGVTVVCSPKAPRVHQSLLRHVSAYKYVLHVDHVDPVDGLPTSILAITPGERKAAPARPPVGSIVPIFVTPMDTGHAETNAANLSAAAQSCMEFGYILNVQLHKIAGLP